MGVCYFCTLFNQDRMPHGRLLSSSTHRLPVLRPRLSLCSTTTTATCAWGSDHWARDIDPSGLIMAMSHAKPSSSKITLEHIPPRRRLRRSRHHLPAPSAAALAALGTIASVHTVDGRPLQTPPPFLCPFLHDVSCALDTSLPTATPARRPAASQPTPAPDSVDFEGHHHFHHSAYPSTVTRAAILTQRSFTVPDKWEKADDGLWHKTDEWALYGSSGCGVRIHFAFRA